MAPIGINTTQTGSFAGYLCRTFFDQSKIIDDLLKFGEVQRALALMREADA